MKTIRTRSILLALFALASSYSFSQLKITGEVRPRFEYRNGWRTPADSTTNPAAFVDQRTRLYFDYTKDRIQFRATLQDVRVWGSQSQLMAFSNQSNPSGQMTWMHEAWGLAKLNENWGFKFGRQELVYDDHRILGNVAWTQQARSHDAALFQYTGEKLKVHFGGAYNQNSQAATSPYGIGNSYKAMQYAWSNYTVNDNLNFSVLAMGLGQEVEYINKDGDTKYQDNYTLTAGTHVEYKKEKLGVAFNGYYQMGSNNSWPAMSVSAFDVGLDVSYQVADPLKVTLGFEMLSGNNQTDTNGVQNAFMPYFGTNHKFNGYMDYFYVGNHYNSKSDVASVGLTDIFLRLDYQHDKFNIGLTGHAFMTSGDVVDQHWLADPANTTGERRAYSSNFLGAEIDLFGGFNLAPGCAVKLGYSQIVGSTDVMETVKGGDKTVISNWGWCMVVLKPTLFEQKEKKEDQNN